MSRTDPSSQRALHEWIKTLPASKMVYPTESFLDRLKYAFWSFYTPLHPFFRDIFVWLGFRKLLRAARVISYDDRQEYLLGKIAPHHTHASIIHHLIQKGYGNHFVAWKDRGQVASLRKAVDFRYQYHLRLFEDGEVRGHYEYTPEYRPWAHLRERGRENRRNEFIALLRDYIVPA